MLRHTLKRAVAGLVALMVAGAALIALPTLAYAGPTTVVRNFDWSASTQTFTVPAGITQLTITATGGQGGMGGDDSQGPPFPGGYTGLVSGTIDVTPGQVFTIGVGGGGGTGATSTNNQNAGGAGGTNPIGGYAGGKGGAPGNLGSSGGGGGGGAATVIQTSGATIVAAGAGGNGGSGQFATLNGRTAYSTYTAREDATSTNGQAGKNVVSLCSGNCDGGGGGAGGGGVQGGAQGNIEFGTGSYTEWFGYGGYPGQSTTGNLNGLGTSYLYYPANGAAGAVSFTYVTGAPDVPTAVGGSAADSGVNLTWNAPASNGQSVISDYLVQYALASTPTVWNSFTDAESVATSATVTGLTNNTAYIFRIAAVSAAGTSAYSVASSSITPVGAPAGPTALAATPGDGTLSVAFTAAVSGSTVLDYQYRIGANGGWMSSGRTTSPVTVAGLTNGTQYSVYLRAISSIGNGAVSSVVTGTPQTAPGAPSITSITTSAGTATVSFTSGFSGGGSILDYQYQLDGTGPWHSAGTTSSPLQVTGLANGSSHTIAIRATNSAGAGAASQTSTATVPALPGAPAISSITPADGSLSVSFTPGTTGGSPVIGYQYQLTTGGGWVVAPALTSPLVIPALDNGGLYQISIRAINGVGTGSASAPVDATPATTPGAPSIVGDTVAGSDATLSAAFTAPVSDGGAAITTYEYSTDAGLTWRARQVSGATSPLVITTLSSDGTTPLTNGTTYLVELRAVNPMGVGTASAVAAGIASTVPSAPSITSVTGGPGSLDVTFTPGSNGGAAITSYEYRLDGGTWTGTGSTGTSIHLSGLTNGHGYAVEVRAVNLNGSGTESAPLSATPVTAPAEPSITGVTRADRQLSVFFDASDDGGSPITSWEYSTDNGTTWALATGTTSPLLITHLSSNPASSLVNSTAYPVAIRATNASGTGVASATATAAPATSPSAPSVSLSAKNQAIEVTFTASSDGGSPVSAVEYSLDGTTWRDAGTLASPFTIPGLANGTQYQVSVRQDNIIGTGDSSVAASATPKTAPDAPASVIAASDTAKANVTWNAPVSDGGSAITGYTATAFSSSTTTTPFATCTSSSLACSITGLVNGTTYFVSVTATNAVGASTPSAPRVLVTPLARPSAPTIGTIAAGNSFLTVPFTAGSAGSSPITGYDYQLNGGAWVSLSTTTSPITLSNLSNGTSYAIALRARSAAGIGLASTAVTSTPYTVPDAVDPATIFADTRDGSIIVNWAAADANGSAITQYDAVAWNAVTGGAQAKTCTTTGALSCTLSGLSNGTTYYITLQATNAAGASVRSTPRVAAVPGVLPGAVSGIAGVGGNGQVALSWTAGSRGASAITDYTISYSSDGTTYTPFADGTSVAAATTVTGLTNGTPYTFRITPVNGSGAGTAATSAAFTPVTPGVAPTVSNLTSLSLGYSFTIANYDSSLSYGLTWSGDISATRSGANVIVSGVAAGDSGAVKVTSLSATIGAASTIVHGSSLAGGTLPTFTTPARTVGGFTFTIDNYDPATAYALSSSPGTATISGSTVTVTGLSAGQSATVTVTASLAGTSDVAATRSGTAMASGTAPTTADVVRTSDGFTFTIDNYNPALSYSFTGTNGASATNAGSAVTVSGLAAGANSVVTVTATNPSQSFASATVSGTSLAAGLVPVGASPVHLTDGYSFVISNYDPSFTFQVTSDHGSVSIGAGGIVTVTGLTPGETAITTLLVSRTGYASTGIQVSGSALFTGVTPLFSAVTGTANGFSFDITNFDAAATYYLTVASGLGATLNGHTVTVTGAAPTALAEVQVTVSRTGYVDASAVQSGNALDVGPSPVPTAAAATADGFSFTITDYDPSLTYTFSATNGATVTQVDGVVTVSGLAPGASTVVTVTATDPGVSTASTTVSGSALQTGTAPVLSATTSLPHGYSFQIVNLSTTSYSFATTNGGTATISGSTVTVTGLDPATVATTTVTATLSGYTALSATATGSSFGGGSVPSVTSNIQTDDGFHFQITNYSADYDYVITVDKGTATMSAGTLTVTGLTPGQAATVHIVTSKAGELDEIADITGAAIANGIAPEFSAAEATANGFVITISNYSAAFAYSVTASNGTATRNDGRITVSGLAAGASASVEVTATRAGFHPASATANGTARPAPAVAPVAPATAPAPAPFTSTPIAPNVPEQTPGKSMVMVSGLPAEAVITPGPSSMTVTSGKLMLKLALEGDAKKGQPIDGTTVTLSPGDELRITVSGFLGGSQVGVWAFSTPTLLSQPIVTKDTKATGIFTLPDSLAPGDHTLVISGTSADGEPVSMSVGFVIEAAKAAVTGAALGAGTPAGLPLSAVIGGSISLLLVAAAVMFFLLAARRRRHREDEEFEDSWLAS